MNSEILDSFKFDFVESGLETVFGVVFEVGFVVIFIDSRLGVAETGWTSVIWLGVFIILILSVIFELSAILELSAIFGSLSASGMVKLLTEPSNFDF